MDEMLKYKNRDGIVQVYFADERPRFGKGRTSISCKAIPSI